MKKILLYAVGCVVIVLCVVCYFVFIQTRELQECKNEQDKISGCVERKYDTFEDVWSETRYKNGEKYGLATRHYKTGIYGLKLGMNMVSNMVLQKNIIKMGN